MGKTKTIHLSVDDVLASEHMKKYREDYYEMIHTQPHTKLEALRSRIAAVPIEEIRQAVIEDEIELLQSRLEPHDTGTLHTAISVLTHRLKELKHGGY